jgi:hypothetical protein
MSAKAESKQIGFYAIYRWLADTLEAKGVSNTSVASRACR